MTLNIIYTVGINLISAAVYIVLPIIIIIIPVSIQLNDGYHILLSESPRKPRAICIGQNIDAIFFAF